MNTEERIYSLFLVIQLQFGTHKKMICWYMQFMGTYTLRVDQGFASSRCWEPPQGFSVGVVPMEAAVGLGGCGERRQVLLRHPLSTSCLLLLHLPNSHLVLPFPGEHTVSKQCFLWGNDAEGSKYPSTPPPPCPSQTDLQMKALHNPKGVKKNAPSSFVQNLHDPHPVSEGQSKILPVLALCLM